MPIASDCASCATSSSVSSPRGRFGFVNTCRCRHHADGYVNTCRFRHHVDAPRSPASLRECSPRRPTPFPTGELDQDGDSHTTLDELMAGLLGTAPLKGIVGDAVALHEDAHDDAFNESDSSEDDLDRQIGSPSVSFRHPKVH